MRRAKKISGMGDFVSTWTNAEKQMGQGLAAGPNPL